MNPKVPTKRFRLAIAASAGAVCGVLLAVISVPARNGEQAPWGILIWGVPIGVFCGSLAGIFIWWVTSIIAKPAHSSVVINISVVLVPIILSALVGFFSFGINHPLSILAGVIAALFGLACGILELLCQARAVPAPLSGRL